MSSKKKSLSLSSSTKSKHYPWSQKRLSSFNPFPRHNLSASDYAINDKLFLFGGISQNKATNEVFVVEVDSLNVLPIVTLGSVPQARSLHTQINVGTSLFVYGGKLDDPNNKLDENIYILDADTKNVTKNIWTKPSMAGDLPSRRYGHTSTLIGTTIYIFGGQDDQRFFNDLISFDIKNFKSQKKKNKFVKFALKGNNNHLLSWNVIVPKNSPPPPRSGHVSCIYENKIYVFGGSDGERFYNDTWCYDIQEKSWSELPCIGYLPVPREFHDATIVNDVMYVFGGRTKEGSELKELGDLCAFRISNLRWYKFPNLGPSPCPRYGHTMTVSQEKVYIFGGESSQLQKPDQDGTIHILDTSKIKFPTGTQPTKAQIPEQRSENITTVSLSTPQPLDALNSLEKQIIPAGIRPPKAGLQQIPEENFIQPVKILTGLSPPPRPTSSQSIDAAKIKILTGNRSKALSFQQISVENYTQSEKTLTSLSPPPRPLSSQSTDSAKMKGTRPIKTGLQQIPEENSSQLEKIFPPQSQPPSQPLPLPPKHPRPLPPPTQPPPPTPPHKSSKGKEVDRGPISIISPPTISQPKVITSEIIMPMNKKSFFPKRPTTSVLKGKMRENVNYFQPQQYSPTDSENSSYELQTIGSNGNSLQQSPKYLNNNNNSYGNNNIESPLLTPTRQRVNSQSIQDMSIKREPFEIQKTILEDSTVITSPNETSNNRISRLHRRTASQELPVSSTRVLTPRRISVDHYSRPILQDLFINPSPQELPKRRASTENYKTTPRQTYADIQRSITPISGFPSLVQNQRTTSQVTEFPSKWISIDNQKNNQRTISTIKEVSSERTLIDNQKTTSPITEFPSSRTSIDNQRAISPKRSLVDNQKTTSEQTSIDDQKTTSLITELSLTRTLFDDQNITSEFPSKRTSVDDQNATPPKTLVDEPISLTKTLIDDQKIPSEFPSKRISIDDQNITSPISETSSRRTSDNQKTMSPITEFQTSIDDQSETSPKTLVDDQKILSEFPSKRTSIDDQNATSPKTLIDDQKIPSEFSSKRISIDDQNITSPISETSRRTSDDQKTMSPITEFQTSIDDQNETSPKTLVDDQKIPSEFPLKRTSIDDQNETSPKTLIDDQKIPSEFPSKRISIDDQNITSPISETSSRRTSDDQKTMSPITEFQTSIDDQNETSPKTLVDDQKIPSEFPSKRISIDDQNITSPISETSSRRISDDDQKTMSPITEFQTSTDDQSTTSPLMKSPSTTDQNTTSESPLKRTSIDDQNTTSLVTEFPSTRTSIENSLVNNNNNNDSRSTADDQGSSISPESLVIKESVTNGEDNITIDNSENTTEKIENIQNISNNSSSYSSIVSIDKSIKRVSLDSLASSKSNQSITSSSSHRSVNEARPRGARPMGGRPNRSSRVLTRTYSDESDRENIIKLRETLAHSKFSDSSDDLSIASSHSVYSNDDTPPTQTQQQQSLNSSVSDVKLNNDDDDNDDNEIQPPVVDEDENSLYNDNSIITTTSVTSTNIDQIPKLDVTENISNEIDEELKAELDSARKSGFTPDLYDDANNDDDSSIEEEIEQLINEEDNDDIESNTDQCRVVEAIMQIQQKLLKAKETVASQAEVLSQKISSSERSRSAAMQEATYFKTKLDTLVKSKSFESNISNVESNKTKELEKQLIKIVSENKNLENRYSELCQSSNLEKSITKSINDQVRIDLTRAETAEKASERVLSKLVALRLRTTTAESQVEESNKQLEKINHELELSRKEKTNDRLQIKNLQTRISHHHQIFDQVSNAVQVANERADEAENLWKQSRNDILKLEKQVVGLKIELENKTRELDNAVVRVDEMEILLGKVQREGNIVRNMMQEGMSELLNINWWDKVGNNNVWENAKIRKLEEELAQLKNMRDDDNFINL